MEIDIVGMEYDFSSFSISAPSERFVDSDPWRDEQQLKIEFGEGSEH